MRLLVTTPMAVILDRDDAAYVRAEDETGAFGILEGHADFMTVLSISVIAWRDNAGGEHFVAVRGGVMTVSDGSSIEVATRDAVVDESLRKLDESILTRFRADEEAEAESRVSATRLHLATIRQIQRYLQAGRQPMPQGAPASLGRASGSPKESGFE
jgi:F-type H+-transporting ATPase subunit epsilon